MPPKSWLMPRPGIEPATFGAWVDAQPAQPPARMRPSLGSTDLVITFLLPHSLPVHVVSVDPDFQDGRLHPSTTQLSRGRRAELSDVCKADRERERGSGTSGVLQGGPGLREPEGSWWLPLRGCPRGSTSGSLFVCR